MTKKLRTHTDDQLGARLGEAISARVEAISTMPLENVRVRALVVDRPLGRRRWAALATAVFLVGGLGTAASIRVAQSHKPTRVQVVSPTVDAALPHLVAHADGWRPVMYMSAAEMLPSPPQLSAHVRNGRTWFDVTTTNGTGALPVELDPRVETIAIGAATGQMVKQGGSFFIVWNVGGQRFRAYGNGVPGQETLDALAAVPSDPARLVSTAFPHGFTATITEALGDRYQINYAPSANAQPLREVNISVSSRPQYFEDYMQGRKTIDRGGRRYYVQPTAGVTVNDVVFRIGNAVVNVGASSSADDLLAFVDTITEATPADWAQIEALPSMMNGPGPYGPPPNVLVDGDIGATHYELITDDKGESCTSLTLHLAKQTVPYCIPNSDADPFRLLHARAVGDETLVFGVDAPDPRDNHVVRVIDADGDIVAEDVTTDTHGIDGRAFALTLPADSVAPFTVELYDFDREWFTSGDTQPDSYVRPGSAPLASKVVQPDR
jgi:hypothetical protein